MKTCDLTGPALNFAVAWALGQRPSMFIFDRTGDLAKEHHYSTDWAQGGPIIERERITLLDPVLYGGWRGRKLMVELNEVIDYYGTTPLIAAMRCFVVSKLGDEVEIPKELQ